MQSGADYAKNTLTSLPNKQQESAYRGW